MRALPLICLPFVATLACSTPEPSSGVTGAKSLAASESLRDYFVVLRGPSAVEAIPPGMPATSKEAARFSRVRIAEIETAQNALRPLLEGHGAKIVASFSRLANALQVLAPPSSVQRLRALPGVVRVERVPLVKPALASSVPVVGAPKAWSEAVPIQGDGITVGTIDSGIDYTHADFGGPGTEAAYLANDSKVIEPGSFPTTKVVGGWDFVGDDYDASTNTVPVPDPDPLDCVKPESQQIAGGHGTHVAGIAAGMGVNADGTTFSGSYDQSLDLTKFLVAPGVAPRAKLYSLKVFGCQGSTAALGQALERASDPNQDGAFDDRLDVVNASLGTSYGLEYPTIGVLVANLTKVGTLLVVAAGNDGQNFFDVGSPSVFPSTISVAASSDNQFVLLTVTAPASVAGDYVASEAGATTPLSSVGKISGALVLADPANGCTALTNAAAVAGNFVMMDRGQCQSSKKFANAVAAGASAIVLVDTQDQALPFSVGGGDPGSISIPGAMIRKADGDKLKAALAAGSVSAEFDPSKKYSGPGLELIAGFSSRGPSPIDDHLKPEIAAPGVSIDSARVGSGTLARRSQGTSMASPFVAGAAALVREAHPTLSPVEVKALLMNGAETIEDLSGNVYSASTFGSGRLAVQRSVDLFVTALADETTGEVGVSFGSVVAAEKTSLKRSFVVKNHGTASASLSLGVEPAFALAGVDVTVSPTSLDVAAGDSASVELTLSLDPKTLGDPDPDPATDATQASQPRHYLNEASGLVRLTSTTPGFDLVVPYLGSVRAAGHQKAVAPAGCDAPSTKTPISIGLTGDSAHPKPVVTAFQLGTLDPARDESATDPAIAMVDLRAVGAATNLSVADSFDTASVYFGVAVSGEWTTPAHATLSVVSIDVDADGDGVADHEVRAEALSAQGPYADVLVANTYDLSTNQPSQTPRFINMVDAATAATSPFHNSVLVLPAYLKDLGLTQDNPVFSYMAVSASPALDSTGERTDWVSFDAAHPAVDPAKPSADGRPIYTGDSPVLVDVSADAVAAGQPLDLLLLHHDNVAGERFEVVSLAAPTPGNLSLALQAPDSVSSGTSAKLVLTATNAGPNPSGEVKLTGTLNGAKLDSAVPSQGTCTSGLDCNFGPLDAGANATLTLTVEPNAGVGAVVVSAKADSGIACETSQSDNVVDADVPVTTAKTPVHTLTASGGCSCRVAEAPRTSALAWLSAVALAAGLARRRRGLR